MNKEKGLLPLVEQETSVAMLRDVSRDQTRFMISYGRISRANPELITCADYFSVGTEYPVLSRKSAVYVYGLLEKHGRLPVISRETAEFVMDTLVRGGISYLAKTITRLKRENPHTISFLLNYARSTPQPKTAISAGVATYLLLEEQAKQEKEMFSREGLGLQLEVALYTEDFERAANLRDKIKEITEGVKNG